MSEKGLKRTVYRLRELETKAAQLAGEIEALKSEMKAELTARDVEEMQVDVFRVRWATVQSCRFDNSAFKRAAPELYAQFMRQTETRRFTVA